MKQLSNNKKIPEKFYSISLVAVLLIVWQVVSDVGIVPSFMLPSPITVIKVFIKDFPVLMDNLSITLLAGLLGLTFGVIAGFCLAVLMDSREGLRKAIYPILIFSQTIPTVAIAPLLVLWLGYGLAPKITVIFLVTFFPVAVNLLESFQATDPDQIRLLQAMGATNFQVFYYVKWPGALDSFFAALKVSASYSIVGAVIAEWLGGSKGLGVYMTQVRKSFAYDKMFAVIFLISALSLVLIFALNIIQNKIMPWKKFQSGKDTNNEEND
ncbi:MAG: ABC transporter permease [Clostridiaceae bacterium]|nr:ABC transporter permease [Clostridiaceae bacterium]